MNHKTAIPQVAKLNFKTDPPTLDPRKGGDLISSTVQFMLFEGLTKMTPKSTTELALAENITVSNDGKTYTFFLKERFWSNGELVTAYDFEKAWKDILLPEFPCPNAHLLFPIKNAEAAKKGFCSIEDVGIQAVSAKTLIVNLEQPTPFFLELTSFCTFFPIKREVVNQDPKWADKPGPNFICNGPFVLEKWKKSDELVVKKNPLYWDKENIKLDEIRISFVDDEMTAMQLYEKDEIDILGYPFTDIPTDSIPTLMQNHQLNMHPVAGTTICPFNMQKFPFNNLNIRKAFNLAIKRKEIIDHITQLGEKIALSCVPPVLKNGREISFFQDGDNEMARKHFSLGLKELNISKEDFPHITMLYPNSDTFKKVACTLQQQWHSVLGIKISIEGLDLRVFLDRMSKRDFTLAQFGWLAQYNDAMNILDRFKFKNNPKNYAGWENPAYIQILDQYLAATDKKMQLKLMEEAEKIFISELPVAVVYHWDYAFLQKPYLKNVFVSPIGSIHFDGAYLQQPFFASLNPISHEHD